MSELKAHRFITTDELFPEANFGTLYYTKDEADKAITEKDKEIEELKFQVNGLKNRSNLWHYNAVEEHKKFVQVDLEITELKKKHKTEIKELLCLIRDKENNFNRAFDSEENEIRHNKYKRCLANAEMANLMSLRYYFVFCLDSHDGIVSGCTSNRSVRKRDFWDKWEIKWLKLADKFKEAK